MVRKKSGDVHPCVDFRRLNSLTLNSNALPIPRIEDSINALAGSTVYSVTDFLSAYCQVPMAEKDIPKTAFCSKYGLHEFLFLPFGLTGAPATYQRLMELVLAGLQWSICLIYLDDVIIFGCNFEENIECLDVVLTRFGAAGLKLKPAKCLFFSDRVTFLGHVITKEGILPDPDNLAKIANWPVPQNVREVRGIIGLGNYYRRFVKDYSKRVQPLVSLTKKNTPFKWTQECQEAFEDLKKALLGPDTMSFPTDDGLFILDTDASDETIGAVLSQVQLGREKVIAFGSRSLGKSERNYCATDRELLVLKYFVQYYKHYLLGRKFIVRSDHESLKWLYSLKEPKHRIARWIEVLSEFNFELEY